MSNFAKVSSALVRTSFPDPRSAVGRIRLLAIHRTLAPASAFYKDEKGEIYHTYSTYARGVDMLNAAYQYLDLTAKGRDEDLSGDHPSGWVRHHDEYGV
jgi:predicted dithiol-disulfide oxidoreductase (DUF899 family)